MNRSELSDLVAERLRVPKVFGEKVVKAVLEGIAEGLREEGSVTLVHFGTFEVKQRRARTGRNPQTGDLIRIRASKSVGFRPGRTLKASI